MLSLKFKAHISPQLYRPRLLGSIWCLHCVHPKCVHFSPASSVPRYCFPVAMTHFTCTWPWKAELITSHPTKRQSRIVVCGCSHVMWAGVDQERGEGRCTVPSGKRKMTLETGESVQKQLRSTPKDNFKRWPYYFEIRQHNMHNSNSHVFANHQTFWQRPLSDDAMSGMWGAHVFH